MMIAVQLSTIVIIALIAMIFGMLVGVSMTLPLGGRKNDSKLMEKVEEAEERVDELPEKSKPAWDLARVTLESYFNRNLKQINIIFVISVLVMIIGFLIITWGIFSAFQEPDSQIVVIVSTVSGIITEIIGATFLFLYRSTIQQAASFLNTLERMNSVGMAMQILDTMPNRSKETSLKDTTKASVVKLLMRDANSLDSLRKQEELS